MAISRRNFQKALAGLARGKPAIPARLGNGQGTVTVAGTNKQYCYARPYGRGPAIAVLNLVTSHLNNLPVKLGYDASSPNVLQVIGVEFFAGADLGEGSPLVPAHDHQYNSANPAYLDTRQIINGLAYATGGLVVTINAGYAEGRGGTIYWPKTEVDLTSYVPVSDGLYVLLSADGSTPILVTEGAGVSLASLTWSDIPDPEEGTAPLWAVRLYAGQTEISMLYSDPDLVDLRFATRRFEFPALDDLSDVDAPAPSDGQVLTWVDAENEWQAADVATTFLDLEDVDPASYTGHAGEPVVVNEAEDGLEFANGAGAGVQMMAPIVLLDETAPSGGQAAFSVSSIAAGYAWIEAQISGKTENTGDANGIVYLALSNDTTAANYRVVEHYAYDGGHDKAVADSRYIGNIGGNGSDGGMLRVTIPDPDGTTFRKIALGQSGARLGASSTLNDQVTLAWEDTGAVTDIDLTSDADFAEGTRCIIIGWRKVYVNPPAQVVDARIDDAINDTTWDATTAGVLDALRDAMIANGLMAAS